MAALAPTALAEPDAELGARLYEDHADELLRYCRGQLGSETEAEDAVQTTFVCALRALRRGTVPENEAAWLTTIARNVCHWQRRTLARRGWQGGDVDLDTFASTSPEPGSYEDLRGLDEALASIPEQQRRAIVLREWLGVAPAEIAGKLGLTPTATHALLTRGADSGAVTVSPRGGTSRAPSTAAPTVRPSAPSSPAARRASQSPFRLVSRGRVRASPRRPAASSRRRRPARRRLDPRLPRPSHPPSRCPRRRAFLSCPRRSSRRSIRP